MLPVIFSLWIIFNGKLNPETALFGLAVSIAAVWFARKYMGYSRSTWVKFDLLILHILRYILVLVWETVKANLYVSKIIYSGKIEIQPQLVFFRTDLKSAVARVVLANSITLTPGTLTVVLNDDRFCVHCLNSDLAEGIDKSVFIKQLKTIEENK